MVISDTSLSYLDLFQLVLPNHSYPRRLLLHRQPIAQPPVPTPTSGTKTTESNFDSNVIMILAVLLCALICALGLNSIVRCALQCSSRMAFHYSPDGERCVVGGVKKKALKSMPTLTYSDGMVLPVSGSDCAICLSDFGHGEKVRVLPKCNHGFHVACIDRWLSSHSSCPTCRRCLFTNGCKRESRCGVEAAAPPRPVVLSPLDPEDPLYNYRGPY